MINFYIKNNKIFIDFFKEINQKENKEKLYTMYINKISNKMLENNLVHEELYNGVYYYKNVIKDPQKLIYLIESTEGMEFLQHVIPNWIDWGVEADRGTVYWYGRKKRVLLNDLDEINTVEIPDFERKLCKEIFDTIFDAFRAVANDYKIKRNISDEVIILNQMNIHKYKENTWMGTHYDAQEGDTRLKYSLLVYINDDYEGGEISFPFLNITIKPKANQLLIFPSAYLFVHSISEVKKSRRLAIVGFAQ